MTLELGHHLSRTNELSAIAGDETRGLPHATRYALPTSRLRDLWPVLMARLTLGIPSREQVIDAGLASHRASLAHSSTAEVADPLAEFEDLVGDLCPGEP